MKFIFNILLLLNREKLMGSELNVVAPFIKLDSRRNPLIDSFGSGINLLNKNKQLRTFHLAAQFCKIQNISNLISTHIQFLYLGDLDLISFESFLIFYQSKDYKKDSMLISLEISGCKSIFEFDLVKNDGIKGMQGDNPITLKEFGFYCAIPITSESMDQLLIKANGNGVEKMKFKIKQNKPEEYLSFNYDKYYYGDEIINNKGNKYITIIEKFKLYKGKKICQKFLGFVMPQHKKEITIQLLK